MVKFKELFISFLKDYIFYSSGTETPEEYLYWGGLSLLGHVLGHKVWIEHGTEGRFKFRPNLYVCLVGEAGSGKNTAINVNKDIMLETFPDHLLSASIQSREDIADLMASEACVKTWPPPELCVRNKIAPSEYRPFYILNDEFASFLSQDKMKMVEFLTDVFDSKRFATGFKGQRKLEPGRRQWFDNPHVSVLAGAVPTWFMESLRMDLFTGGLGRRLFIVNAKRTKVIEFPFSPPGAKEAMQRIIAHLKEAAVAFGPVVLDDGAKAWWGPWYRAERKLLIDDPILSQFHQTKPMQVLKLACLLTKTESATANRVEADHLKFAAKLVSDLEEPIVKLTAGIGRNALAGVGTQVIEFLNRMEHGAAPRNVLLKVFGRNFRLPEFIEQMEQYVQAGRIVKIGDDPNSVFVLRERLDEFKDFARKGEK